MTKLKILITTYQEAFLVRGGGEYELLTIAESLRQFGFIVDIYGPYSRPLEFFDVVLHFSVHGRSFELLREIKARGKPIVLWPNLWVNYVNEKNIEVIYKHVDLADFVVFKSAAEFNNFSEIVDVPKQKRMRCKMVIDNSYLKTSPRFLFQELFGLNEYALWMGIIEPNKNQLSIIGPLKEFGIPLVFVGKYRDKAYYEVCRKVGGDGVLFIDSLPQRSELVRSAFQNASFYAELSLEPAGISAMEAGLSGCRMLLSDSDWSREHFQDHVEYADPLSSTSIADGIGRVLKRPALNMRLQKHMQDFCFPNALLPLVEVLKKATK